MVCEKCEKKLAKVIVPDKWKEGASNTNESGGRKINENKLLSKKNRWTPYGTTKCIICKQQVHQNAKYCHTCAYTKGILQFLSDHVAQCFSFFALMENWWVGSIGVPLLDLILVESPAGICAMCGKQVLDTKQYKQSNV
ncbi:Cysteine-rich PDZ-binding protein [Nymphaea thermarum]|nr:Cysteine-rich PDZ-binding protein [Nymphaea thermarum]